MKSQKNMFLRFVAFAFLMLNTRLCATEIDLYAIAAGPVPLASIANNKVEVLPQSATILNNIPTSNWTYGCSNTAAGIRVQAAVSAGSTSDYLIDPYNHTGYAQVFKEKTTADPNYMVYIFGHDAIAQASGLLIDIEDTPLAESMTNLRQFKFFVNLCSQRLYVFKTLCAFGD